ncbi:unnamed protein product [Rotaria sp. Silwood1]|nr:unnamed protein product [Rotaria sp. Silwood1]CAF1194638.1 unnamed protein product [Rotaria sp. Silwood1]CAF1198165.1 unnamed protein product [Rotaria sp. Silwood1]CAF3454276.1 unnamed protein product [Rotaria sp. Silwood1]CAF3468198.1 unnamed protein product [Rotaria sp. Silwood1]
MSSMINNMIKKIILFEDGSQMVDELIRDQTAQLEDIISVIFDNIEHVKNEGKMKNLAKIIADASFKKRSLNYVNNQMNYINENETSALKKNFVRKILTEIVDLLIKNADDNDLPLWIEYGRLSQILMS